MRTFRHRLAVYVPVTTIGSGVAGALVLWWWMSDCEVLEGACDLGGVVLLVAWVLAATAAWALIGVIELVLAVTRTWRAPRPGSR